MPKPARTRDDTRNEILNAARELFLSDGYENVSMRKVASRIGYTPTTIYLYFRDKSELLRAICESTFESLAEEIVASHEGSVDPMDKLRRGLRTYVDFGLRHPNHYSIVFNSPKVRLMGESEYSFQGSMGQRAFELLGASVAECMAAGSIQKGEAALIAQTLWAGIHGVTALLIEHQGFPFVEHNKLIDSVIDTMIAGIRENVRDENI